MFADSGFSDLMEHDYGRERESTVFTLLGTVLGLEGQTVRKTDAVCPLVDLNTLVGALGCMEIDK